MIAIGLTIADIAIQAYSTVIIAVTSILVFSGLLWLNHKRKYVLVILTFLNFTTLVIAMTVWISFEDGRFVEKENILYAVLVGAVFLLDKYKMRVQSALILLVLLGTKVQMFIVQELPLDDVFILLILRVTALGVSIFVCTSIFKKGLVESLEMEEKANTSKNKMFSIVAHDIRSPLSMLSGILELNEEVSKMAYGKFRATLLERVNTLKRTIDNLLDWAKSQIDGIEIRPESVSLDELIQENLLLFQMLADQKKLKIKLDSNDPKVWIHKNHLNMALRNMIHNSIKYSQENGVVDIRAMEKKGKVVLEIQDSGVGMNEKQIMLINEFQFQPSTMGTSGEKGSGIGLNLSIELLRKNGCEVFLSSTLGTGVLIQIMLPSIPTHF